MEESDLGTTTPLEQGAVAMNELFRSYVKAGFTEDQALTLLIGMVKNNGG